MVADDQEVDITRFIELHPGDHQVLNDVIEYDATAVWDDDSNSEDAMMMLTKYATPNATSMLRTERNLNWIWAHEMDSTVLYTRPFSYIRNLMLKSLYS